MLSFWAVKYYNFLSIRRHVYHGKILFAFNNEQLCFFSSSLLLTINGNIPNWAAETAACYVASRE